MKPRGKARGQPASGKKKTATKRKRISRIQALTLQPSSGRVSTTPPIAITPSPSFDLSSKTLNNDWSFETDRKRARNTTSTPQQPMSNFKTPRVLQPFSKNLFSGSPRAKSNAAFVAEVDSDSVNKQVSFLTTPSKSTPNQLMLSNWGLPKKVLDEYSRRGIRSMFEWQAECLSLPGVLSGGNLVFSAPTSAGKTLVAELVALKCVLESRKKVIFILPFVSIAHEKARYLQSILEPQGVRIGGFMGNQSPAGGFSSVDIAICTIEKANSLINHLLEERAIHELGALVVDELHMIGDQHRGYLLELLLTKILYIEKVGKSFSLKIQVIGMSATLPNLGVLANWLCGHFYCTDFRPTPLKEMVKIGHTLFDTNFRTLREFDPSECIPGDEDDILTICHEYVLKGRSVLIFCPTKAWCENLALTLADALGKLNLDVPDTPRLIGVCEQLRRTQVGLDRALEKTIPNRVAFHHAGLTFEEREIVEGSFRQTLVKVLIATSTLSSGVNLPARLVIVRTPFFQRSLMDIQIYKQMTGRAGRKGVDELGESILMCKPTERSKVVGLFKSAPKPVESCLCLCRDSKAKNAKAGSKMLPMKRALLEVIASGVAVTRQEVALYCSCTLYHAEHKEKAKKLSVPTCQENSQNMRDVSDNTLTFLLSNDFISCRIKSGSDLHLAKDGGGGGGTAPTTEELYATQLGMATVASALSPDEALVVFRELRKARRSFVLESELHIIYLITPVYIQDQWPNIDWYKYLCIWERLPEDMKHVSEVLGVRESFLAQAIQGRIPEWTESQQESLRLHRRFFTALALHDLVHEVPIMQVARQYGATKGLLQTLQSSAGTFAGMVTVFCSRLGWSNLELLLSQFQSRLTFGVERELCDLVAISLLNGFRARVLYNSGYHTVAALANANPIAVETCLRNAIPFKSYKLSEGSGGPVESAWCSKLKKGMTESDMAVLIVNEARSILSWQLNVPLSAWNEECKMSTPGSSSSPRPANCPDGDRENRRIGPGVKQINLSAEMDCQKVSGSFVQKNTSVVVETQAESKEIIPTSTPLLNISQLEFSSVNFSPDTSEPHTLPSSGKNGVFNLSPIADTGTSVLTTDTEQIFEVDNSLIVRLSFDTEGGASEGKSDLVKMPVSTSSSIQCTPDSFSFQTFAMIDAACNGEAKTVAGKCIKEGSQSLKLPVGPEVRSKATTLGRSIGHHEVSTDVHLTSPQPVDISVLAPETPSSFHPSEVKEISSLCGLKELSSLCSSQLSHNGLTVISVTSNQRLFETFISECMEQTAVAFSVACTGLEQSSGIGNVIIKSKPSLGIQICASTNQQVVGIAFCWGGMDIYYVSLCQDKTSYGSRSPENSDSLQHHMSLYSGCIPLKDRVTAVETLFRENNWKKVIAYDIKKHAKCLCLACGVMPEGSKSLDPVVASWMLDPDSKEKTIHKIVLQYLPDQPLFWGIESCDDVPLSSVATNNSDPEMQASAESTLAFMLSSKLETLLKAEELYDAYTKLEMPSLLVLTKIEMNGIGFSPEECSRQRDVLQRRLSELEQEAYSIAGHTFSLTSPDDVATVLFLELNLPSGSDADSRQKGHGVANARKPNTRRRIQHLSTAKDVLEKIKPLNPMPGLVLEWRRISSTLTKMVYPLLKDAVPCAGGVSRIYPRVQIHTATGRISLSEPNLQMVPKEFHISATSPLAENRPPFVSGNRFLEGVSQSKDGMVLTPYSICMRGVFQSFPKMVILAADYSQLELRMLAHMSGDKKLKQFLNSDGDAFKMIAGEWLGLSPSCVSEEQRQETKQVCYGMIYGIGSRTLAEQLGITDREASQFIETFRSKYPTMNRFLLGLVEGCKDRGYISTLLGRKRFLSGIHSANIHARSQAERQAVNSTIQGSAADLVKMATVNIDRKIEQFYQDTSATCRISLSITEPGRHAAYLVLQLHDELLYEVLECDLKEVARIVQHEMENALDMSVRFPVKLKAGYSWGQLKPFVV